MWGPVVGPVGVETVGMRRGPCRPLRVWIAQGRHVGPCGLLTVELWRINRMRSGRLSLVGRAVALIDQRTYGQRICPLQFSTPARPWPGAPFSRVITRKLCRVWEFAGSAALSSNFRMNRPCFERRQRRIDPHTERCFERRVPLGVEAKPHHCRIRWQVTYHVMGLGAPDACGGGGCRRPFGNPRWEGKCGDRTDRRKTRQKWPRSQSGVGKKGVWDRKRLWCGTEHPCGV